MGKIKFLFALYVGKIIAVFVKFLAKERGTNKPGEIAYKLNRNFIKQFKGLDREKIIFITGTNGKSTSTNLISHVIKKSGKTVASNCAGANMVGGVATVLLNNSSMKGTFNKDYLVLEIDERSLPKIYKFLRPKHLCITNLQKDQVQRNGDPEFIYSKIKDVLEKDTIIYLNNEEPRSQGLEDYVDKCIYYSVEKNEYSYKDNDFYTVTLPCPKCNSKIIYKYYNLANIGKFNCKKCDYKSKEDPDVYIEKVDFKNKIFIYNKKQYSITYSSPFYIYNYAMCIGICKNIGITDDEIQIGFNTFVNPADRKDILKFKDKEIHYYRMKQENPETLQSALDMISRDEKEKVIFIGLFEIKDFEPHYTNMFYFYDCNLKKVINSNVKEYICFSRSEALDTANRLIYDGAEKENIKIMDTNNIDEVFKDLDEIDCKNIYIVTGMKPYNQIKKYINERG